MAPPNDYQPVPTSAARQIAEDFEKQVVVIVCLDAIHRKTHLTTWGSSPTAKDVAAKWGDLISECLSLSGKEMLEDFRATPEAQCKAKVDALLTACRFVKAFLNRLEENNAQGDRLLAIRRQTHKPLHTILDQAIAKAEEK